MVIINESKDLMIADKVEEATTFLTRLVGLLGKRNLQAGEGLLIAPCKMVHTFFMKFPLCIIFLNEQNSVIKVIPSLAPNRISPFVPAAIKVIELKAKPGLTEQLEVGDKFVLASE